MGITTKPPVDKIEETLEVSEQWVATPSETGEESLQSQSDSATSSPVLEQFGRKYHEDFDFD